MIEHNAHDASGQLSGYLYQVLSALLLLLESRNPDSQLCIEKFDDVAFVEKGKPANNDSDKTSNFIGKEVLAILVLIIGEQ